MPESGKEVAMDTAALQLLGVTPELGAEVTVSYSITDKDQSAFTVTDAFTLVGYWDYDELMPVHYINISRDYADDIEAVSYTHLDVYKRQTLLSLAILFAFFTDSAEKTSYPDFFSENVIPRFKFSSSSTTSIPGIAYAPLFINYVSSSISSVPEYG